MVNNVEKRGDLKVSKRYDESSGESERTYSFNHFGLLSAQYDIMIRSLIANVARVAGW